MKKINFDLKSTFLSNYIYVCCVIFSLAFEYLANYEIHCVNVTEMLSRAY